MIFLLRGAVSVVFWSLPYWDLIGTAGESKKDYSMIDAINTFFSAFPDWLHVLLISAIPVIELRGAIPYGILILKMPWLQSLLVAVAGSIIPAPFILYLARIVLKWMGGSKLAFLRKISEKITERGMKKSEKVKRYTYLGLIMFIAVPLPGTGVWTGCLVAALLGLNPEKSLLCALIGTIIAGIAMVCLVNAGVYLTTAI